MVGWIRVLLEAGILLAIIATFAYVRHVRRAMQRWTSRAVGAGLGEAQRMVGVLVAAQRADADRIVAAIDALVAAQPWRRPPPPPVTMAHRSRVERPPEQPAAAPERALDTWPELPDPPAASARGARPERPDITFHDYSADEATTNDRTLVSERGDR